MYITNNKKIVCFLSFLEVSRIFDNFQIYKKQKFTKLNLTLITKQK